MTNKTTCKIWANWVTSQRQAAGLTKAKLAKATGIDCSYFVLFERDGYVPSRPIVQSIGEYFGCPDVALANAGYVPDSIREPFISLMQYLAKR